MRNREDILWPTFVTLVASAARLYGLARLSLSGDEAFSAVLTTNRTTVRLDELAQGYKRLWLVYGSANQSAHALRPNRYFVLETSEESDEVLAWLAAHRESLVEDTGRFVSLHLLGFDLSDEE